MPLLAPVTLPEEEPQIICSVDCMIHNPRHHYCMDCGQRLMASHVCPNEIENAGPNVMQLTEIEDRRTSTSRIPVPLSTDLDVEIL